MAEKYDTEFIEEYYDVATEYVGTHKLIQISYDTIEVYNENIKNRQSMLTSYTKGLLDKITATKTTMSKSQVSAFEKAIADIDETSDSTSSSESNKNNNTTSPKNDINQNKNISE